MVMNLRQWLKECYLNSQVQAAEKEIFRNVHRVTLRDKMRSCEICKTLNVNLIIPRAISIMMRLPIWLYWLLFSLSQLNCIICKFRTWNSREYASTEEHLRVRWSDSKLIWNQIFALDIIAVNEEQNALQSFVIKLVWFACVILFLLLNDF